jgi:LPS-assembly lipoprotein
VLRLSMLTPEQLATLQQRADDKAKADADALKAAKEYEDNTPKQSPVEVPVE